ncbi:LOW QUALITY PROTEIN: hypothetical protein Cgig2_011078 [Carnegiea gigantea]|uniref:Uncharacterized protein n=1 Tax=Carnegiea gigantea TaxID=171969 RepID=A0A9Q1JSD7_9CARY|nr:LOW QUALITY PROTEIN: hypothetical protein Cgig2_011078 [Carnegiea gigantea]
MLKASLGLLRRLSFGGTVLTAEQGSRITVPTMVFGGEQGPCFTSQHNDLLVVEMKVASAILTYLGRDIVPLVRLILGFGGQKVNPTGVIYLSLFFGDKVRAKNLEVDFLVMDVPTAYNVILGRPTLHKVKRCSPLTFKIIPFDGGWDELHLFGVPAFGLSPLALFHIMNVGLELSSRKLGAKVVKTLRRNSTPSSMAPQIGLLFGLGRLLDPRYSLSLSPCECNLGLGDRFVFLLGLPSGLILPQPFPAAFSLQNKFTKNKAERKAEKRGKKEEYIPPTSAIATSSSVTLMGSEVPEVSKSHDLNQMKRLAKVGMLSTLRKILKNKEPVVAKKKWFSKNFNFGSQFNSSLSLDLLFFLSSPCVDSITWAINLGIGLGRSSSHM